MSFGRFLSFTSFSFKTLTVIFNDLIELDYYFCGDDPEKKYDNDHPHRNLCNLTQVEKTAKKSKSVKTFCVVSIDGHWPGPSGLLFSKDDVARMQANPIELTSSSGPKNFRKDITSGPMYNHSIVFPAIQFLLYTGVEKLYLVGHDQGGKHAYFYTGGDDWKDDQVWNWREFKQFKEEEYPHVKIISVEPRGLKGFFEDMT